MKHIVVRPSGNGLSSVSILDGGATIPKGPFESWALKDGKHIIWANVRMAPLLKNSYVYGSFEGRAVYTFSYDEMCAIITSHVGPSARVMRELASLESEQIKKRKPMYDRWHRWFYGSLISSEIVWTLLYTMLKFTKALFELVLIPLVIHFVKKPK